MHNHKENNNAGQSGSNNDRVYNRGIERLRSPERVERLEVERVVDLCINENIKSVLDIGTGSALFAEAFHKKGFNISGIDSNPEMIEAAKQFAPEGIFKLAPAENIPFEDNSFDITFFGLVFHEVDDYLKALKEAFRVSTVGTFLLEWNYAKEEFGPPIEHRLKSGFIKKISKEIGYNSFEEIKLNDLTLYNLKK
jgi:ubiquinone/menaquinone biosynthesis C-methylase UbiE